MNLRILLAAILCIFVISGCGGDDTTSPNGGGSVIGSWGRNALGAGQFTITFEADGTFTAGADPDITDINGTYNVSGNRITITDDGCGAVQGEYNFAVANDMLTFSLISDNCGSRANVVAGVWNKK